MGTKEQQPAEDPVKETENQGGTGTETGFALQGTGLKEDDPRVTETSNYEGGADQDDQNDYSSTGLKEDPDKETNNDQGVGPDDEVDENYQGGGPDDEVDENDQDGGPDDELDDYNEEDDGEDNYNEEEDGEDNYDEEEDGEDTNDQNLGDEVEGGATSPDGPNEFGDQDNEEEKEEEEEEEDKDPEKEDLNSNNTTTNDQSPQKNEANAGLLPPSGQKSEATSNNDNNDVSPAANPPQQQQQQQQPMSLVQRPMSLVQQPMSLVQRPMSLVQQSMSLVQQPMSLVQRPMSLVQQPMSLVQRPMSLVQQPMSLVQQPRPRPRPRPKTEPEGCTVLPEPQQQASPRVPQQSDQDQMSRPKPKPKPKPKGSTGPPGQGKLQPQQQDPSPVPQQSEQRPKPKPKPKPKPVEQVKLQPQPQPQQAQVVERELQPQPNKEQGPSRSQSGGAEALLPTPGEDSVSLHTAFKGTGNDVGRVVEILSKRDALHLDLIKKEYLKSYGEELSVRLSAELSKVGGDLKERVGVNITPSTNLKFSNNLKRAVSLWILDEGERDATIVYQGLSVLSVDLAAVTEVICSRTPSQLLSLKQAYFALYKSQLLQDINSSVFPVRGWRWNKELLIACLGEKRDRGTNVDETLAMEDAKQLYKDGEQIWGTNEKTFVDIFTQRNRRHLAKVDAAYNELYGHSLEKAVINETSGYFEDGLLILLRCAKNPAKYFAELLYTAMKGLGTADTTLIRVVVTRALVDMEEIKKEYENAYKVSLNKTIHQNTSGPFRTFLLNLVK